MKTAGDIYQDIFITRHALIRFRDRVPGGSRIGFRHLRQRIAEAVKCEPLEMGRRMHTGYFRGRDGELYAIESKTMALGRVMTVVFEPDRVGIQPSNN